MRCSRFCFEVSHCWVIYCCCVIFRSLKQLSNQLGVLMMMNIGDQVVVLVGTESRSKNMAECEEEIERDMNGNYRNETLRQEPKAITTRNKSQHRSNSSCASFEASLSSQ